MLYVPEVRFQYNQRLELSSDSEELLLAYMGKTEYDLDAPIAVCRMAVLGAAGSLVWVQLEVEATTVYLASGHVNARQAEKDFRHWVERGMRTEEEPSYFEYELRGRKPSYVPDTAVWLDIYGNVAWTTNRDMCKLFPDKVRLPRRMNEFLE